MSGVEVAIDKAGDNNKFVVRPNLDWLGSSGIHHLYTYYYWQPLEVYDNLLDNDRHRRPQWEASLSSSSSLSEDRVLMITDNWGFVFEANKALGHLKTKVCGWL